jgi:hypothetical protein
LSDCILEPNDREDTKTPKLKNGKLAKLFGVETKFNVSQLPVTDEFSNSKILQKLNRILLNDI